MAGSTSAGSSMSWPVNRSPAATAAGSCWESTSATGCDRTPTPARTTALPHLRPQQGPSPDDPRLAHSFASALEPGRTSWTVILDVARVRPTDDHTDLTATKLRTVIDALLTSEHWHKGTNRNDNRSPRKYPLIHRDAGKGPTTSQGKTEHGNVTPLHCNYFLHHSPSDTKLHSSFAAEFTESSLPTEGFSTIFFIL